MNSTVHQRWLKELEGRDWSLLEMERAISYTRDLLNGMEAVTRHPQGVTVFGSARFTPGSKEYKKAYELGYKLAKSGHVVVTGGGPGIMEAVSRGAHDGGGVTVGFGLNLPYEQHNNPYLTESMTFEYFFARKVALVNASKMYVYFPGGMGTLDEFSEALELIHTGKITKAPIYLYDSDFWAPLDPFFRDSMLRDGMIEPGSLELYQITDDIDEIVAAAQEAPVRQIGDAVDHGAGLVNPEDVYSEADSGDAARKK